MSQSLVGIVRREVFSLSSRTRHDLDPQEKWCVQNRGHRVQRGRVNSCASVRVSTPRSVQAHGVIDRPEDRLHRSCEARG